MISRYVWLVPFYTYNANEAAVRIELIIQHSSDPNMKDIAKGAGGSFRYLRPIADGSNRNKITELALQRSGKSGADPNYDGATGDINKGRDGDYLYLLWNTAPAF